ncbi:MAG TPA: protein kinase [Ktedonobacteraceae bacterium]|nr:protein kinase [Ktedonobacteraceae bacterium]
MADRVGQQLGNYRLLRLLGAGGFAEVYLGEHVYLGTQAAIKVLQTRLEEDERERFLDEARIVARLVHPHIVRVLEFGVEEDVPFLVLDYAQGGSLRQRLPKGVPLRPETILPYVKQVAAALHYAHEQQLVHRDVKPENMLLGRNGEVFLSDFGIALLAQSTHFEGTQEVFGTATYIAPEQIQGKAQPASDQYSLGVVLYEWLCGTVPFRGSFSELCSQHLFTLPPPLHEKVPGISPTIEAVVEKALAKDPHDRYPSVQTLAAALDEACQHEQPTDSGPEPTVRRPGASSPDAPDASSAPTRYPAILPPSKVEPKEGASLPPTQAVPVPTPKLPDLPTPPAAVPGQKRVLSRREVILGAGTVGLAAAAGVTWFLLSHRESPSPTSTARFTARPSPSPSVSSPSLGTTLMTYRGHTGAVYAATWSPNGQYIASASADTTVRVWSITTGDTLYTYHGHAGLYNSVYAVGWSLNGRRIASGGADKTVQVWDAATGNMAFVYRGHTARVLALAWSPDARYIASGGADRTVQVWDAATGKLIYLFLGHTDDVYTLAWSPDGNYIASGGADKTVQVWEAMTGVPLYTYHGHAEAVYALAFSPQGKDIASGGADRTVQVWEATTGKPLSTYHGHTGLSNVVSAVAWSSDGRRIASGSTDKTVQIWDATTGKHAYSYGEHRGTVFVVEWSPTGPHIASGSADTTVHIWQAT